ncbi:MAG: TonB-dependent receptor [Paludibacteraceae bacterium]|nr:TonB-dependent receptor [Paludibacteraceae bacterium]MBQ8940115.1 TonB-dependent receptor [Paludibacteraceae bacterium]
MQTKYFVLVAAMICAVSMAANNKVSGVIKDAADKTALIGVNVTLRSDKVTKDKVQGTVTDAHGRFSLEAETGEFVLECSYIGYEPIGMSLTVSGNIHLGTIEMNEASTELSEVVVEGDAVIQKVDRQILLPNKEQLGASSDGMSLLQNLQIPRIVVNPADNTVKTLANQDVQLRINGIEASSSEVMAINPKDVIRIEYHDQPGVRFNGAAAVINYIVKHRDTGGNLMLNASNGVTMPGWGEYHLSGKVNFGKSSFSLLTHYSPRDIYWTRTNSETYNFSTGTIENREVGEPTRFKMNPVNIGLTYNWTNGEKNMLNITLRDFMNFTPHSKTNRDSYLYQGTDSFAIHDHESTQSISPSLDIYYEHNLPDDNHLYFDVVGTYINSSNDRRFEQLPLGETVADTTDVTSRVRGNKYSLIGEAIYEKDWENIALTVGVRHNQQWVENTYLGSASATVNMTTAETYAFAEVQQRVKQFSYAVGIGAMHTYIEQAGQKQSNWIARPQLTLSYNFGKGVFWKYKGYVSGYQPSLSAMSDVAQQIDKYQIRQGNPDLKPVMFVANEMQLSWQSKHVNLNIWANYSYDHKPIMDETFELSTLSDNGLSTLSEAVSPMVVRTYANHRGFHRLQVAPSVQVRVLNNSLIFTVAPFANYYVSLGNSYTHKHFNPGVRASIMGMYKGWQFFGEVTTRYNNLWGETLEYGEFYHHIGLGYNADKWGFRAMLMNPFSVKGYSIETKDLSALAPNTQHAEMRDFRQMLILNFHCNLDFGSRASTRENKRINNEDKENGILSGTK